MNGSRGAMFPLLLPTLLAGMQWVLLASGSVLGSQEASNGTVVPSLGTLAGCQTSCGNLTFSYPFGIGPSRCYRGLDFELTCNESARPPILFLRDGVNQVDSSIFTSISSYFGGDQEVDINFVKTIPVSYYGTSSYNMSWHSPGNSFALSYISLNVTGCNFDVYFTDSDANITSPYCTLTCPSWDITDTEARQNCNGTGCCPINWEGTVKSFNLKFVRHREIMNAGSQSNRSSLWDYINVTTVYSALSWNIVDQPSCMSAKKNNYFACVANNSQCMDNDESIDFGYSCSCNPGYLGNPYLLHGCYRDKGYNPAAQQTANCSRVCGNISVPFPFGVEDGCFAREQFYVNCTNVTTSTLQLGYTNYLVTDINIDKGIISYTVPEYDEGSIIFMSEDDPAFSFIQSSCLL